MIEKLEFDIDRAEWKTAKDQHDKINEIIDWINKVDEVSEIIIKSPEDKLVGNDKSRSVAPQDVEITQGKLGDVSGYQDTRKGCGHTLNYLDCEDCKVKE